MKKISTVPTLFLCVGVLFMSCQKEEIKQPVKALAAEALAYLE
jgi:hypothetical protein